MNQQSDIRAGRIDGWKAIGAYFRRDRSTVMRWARERNLPVHKIPGGKQGTVFALEHELLAWQLSQSGLDDGSHGAAAEQQVVEAVADPAPKRGVLFAVLAALIAIAALSTAGWYGLRSGAPSEQRLQMPGDPKVAAIYVAARDAWARRTPEDIAQAIRLFEQVIARQPDFAPAHAGLADAWLIYCEYGKAEPAQAYKKAQAEAALALRYDPDLASGHRAKGFLEYWWLNNKEQGVAAFKRAISLDENDAQTHFWFANILSDLGADDAAEREYARAKLLSPGNPAIQVEYACAQWQAGRDGIAEKLLTQLERRYPADATVHNCLAWLYMGQGDIADVARQYEAMAQRRGEPGLTRLSDALSRAVRSDPGTAHKVLIADHRRQIATGEKHMRQTPAFYASGVGDRAELIALLREAGARKEQWHSHGITSRIAAKWKGDAEIERLLRTVTPPKAERDWL